MRQGGYIWTQWIMGKMHLSISVKAAQLDDSVETVVLEATFLFFSNKKAQRNFCGTESPKDFSL